ncbi:MAG: isoprenyl transferase, partial [Gammaproteobacteria bacterium]
IVNATRQIAEQVKFGTLEIDEINEQCFADHTCLSDLNGLSDPDLFIRTGGEHRISNFLIWQLAYSELYFSDILWPDFDKQTLEDAFEVYASRQRRFGQTGQQLQQPAESTNQEVEQ